VFCVVVVSLSLLFLVIRAANQEPSFLEPRIIANGPKYEPRPYYGDPKIPDQLKELAKYERVTRITE